LREWLKAGSRNGEVAVTQSRADTLRRSTIGRTIKIRINADASGSKMRAD
jgi:hypothetical protein